MALNRKIQSLVHALGLNKLHYSSHSIGSGVATAAGSKGFKDWELKQLGDWSSYAYINYIRTNIRHRLTYTTRLLQP